MNTRVIRARDVAGNDIWEAREFSEPMWDQKPGDTTFWLSTATTNPGFIQHRSMQEVIQFHLKYSPDTNQILTSWGRHVFLENLIPGAIADLAVQALATQEK